MPIAPYEAALCAAAFVFAGPLIAANRFLMPFPGGTAVIVATYMTAQWLIFNRMMRVTAVK